MNQATGFSDGVVATILGLVEGITEFLPVSSTGHLILVGHWLGFTGATAETFEIFIQLGAILAVVVLYWRKFLGLIPLPGRASTGLAGWHGILAIGVACVPAFVLGALCHKAIKTYLFSPATVGYALIVGGLLMVGVERLHSRKRFRTLDGITLRDALAVGVFQCLALWPGMSRSASTIMGGMLVGLERRAAAEFSFLVAVPVMFAATLFDLLRSVEILSYELLPMFATGFLVSFIVAMVAIKTFLTFLRSHTMVPFAVYRLVVGALVLVWL